MNIHHLELFYYVARHGGISEAVRNIPYGIQQPAVSSQVIALEQYLGVKLFTRRPFALTPPGEKLYQFIEPFFANVARMADELRGASQQIRVGASTTVLRDHLPELLHHVRERHPALRVALCEGHQPESLALLARQEIDLAITVIEGKVPGGFNSEALIQLPLVLLLPRKSHYKSADDLWKQDKIEDALIGLPAFEPICKHFQQGLAKLEVDWFPSIVVSSLDLVETYVNAGYGIGLSVALPRSRVPTGLRELPLPGFESITVGALWRGRLTPVAEALIHELRVRAAALKS